MAHSPGGPGDFAARWTVICAQCGLSPFRQVSKCQAPGDPIARWGSERQVTHEFETRALLVDKNLRQVASSPGWPGGSFARWRQVAPTGCRQVGSKWPDYAISSKSHSVVEKQIRGESRSQVSVTVGPKPSILSPTSNQHLKYCVNEQVR